MLSIFINLFRRRGNRREWIPCASPAFRPKGWQPGIEELESRLVPSVSVGILGGVLKATGNNAHDTITLSHSGTATVLSGVSFSDSAFSAILINAGAGNDTINVLSAPAGKPVTINGEAGSDVINLGNGNLDFIPSAVTVNDAEGLDTININDQAFAGHGYRYVVTASTVVVRPWIFGGLTYGRVGALVLNAGNDGNSIDVTSTSVSTTINAGDGDDDVYVGNSLSRLEKPVFVNGGAGINELFVSDADNGYGDFYQITSSQVILPNTLGPVVTYENFHFKNLSTGAGNATVSVSNSNFTLDGIGNWQVQGGWGKNKLAVWDTGNYVGDTYQVDSFGPGEGDVILPYRLGLIVTFSKFQTVDLHPGSPLVIDQHNPADFLLNIFYSYAKTATTTVVASSVNPSVFGQSVTFTATINVLSPGSGTPTGTVLFFNGSYPLSPVRVSTSGGVTAATFSTSSLEAGTHTITATYSGNANFASSSGTLAGGQVVFPVNIARIVTTTAVASSVNPSVFGQSVTFTATINGGSPSIGTPTGAVQFQIDGSNAGYPVTVRTTGGVTTATLSIATLAVGTHTVTATYYSDNATFASSSGTLAGGQVVKASLSTPTVTTLSSSANPSVFGQSVTFTAAVEVLSPSIGTPTGTVQFQIDGSNAGNPVTVRTIGGVTTATLSTASLTVSQHAVTAIYIGNAKFANSIDTLLQVVTVPATTTAVPSSANPSVFGQSVTFTATINAVVSPYGTPTGTVQFQIDGSNAGGPVSVSTTGGVTTATLSLGSLAVGTHTVTAVYRSDGNFLNSSGTLAGGQVVLPVFYWGGGASPASRPLASVKPASLSPAHASDSSAIDAAFATSLDDPLP